MPKINQMNNFCQVFELPESWPTDFCFNGGNPAIILQVDWFHPIPYTDLPEYGGTPKPWSEYREGIINFLKEKQYIKVGRQYWLLTSFGESEVFTKGGFVNESEEAK